MTPNDLVPVRNHISSRVIGQQNLVDGMLICLLCEGHLLVEGMPGLAKTTAVNALSEAIEGDFHRIQFTPDLLPSDLVGTDIYRHEKAEFEFRPGPLFHLPPGLASRACPSIPTPAPAASPPTWPLYWC